MVLRQLGLRYAQGYYLGRPATLETLAIAQAQPSLLKA
jgi:EAL domain-containing protein (putative c-di-GMP-specific phosphodiesterase class I)